jgi:hypothetical protein
MTGFATYQRWQLIEQQAAQLGFRLDKPKYGGWSDSTNDHKDQVSLYPHGDSLPVFTRDAELFAGTFHDVEMFLIGWAKSQQYDMFLRMSDSDKRKKYEDRERERQRLAKEREEKKRMFAILADKSEQEVDKDV